MIVFQIKNKDTETTFIYDTLVFLLLTLNIFSSAWTT